MSDHLDALARELEDAPHSQNCGQRDLLVTRGPCDCWKARALDALAALASRVPEPPQAQVHKSGCRFAGERWDDEEAGRWGCSCVPEPEDDRPPVPVAQSAPAGLREALDLGLNIDSIDADKLAKWADNIEVHGNDLSHWTSHKWIVHELRRLAECVRMEVTDVGELRRLAALAAPVPTPMHLRSAAEQAAYANAHRVVGNCGDDDEASAAPTEAKARLRDCTCLGTCKGKDGLAAGWRCALEPEAAAAPTAAPSAPAGLREALQQLVDAWRVEADEIFDDGDFCCAKTREHDADALAEVVRKALAAPVPLHNEAGLRAALEQIRDIARVNPSSASTLGYLRAIAEAALAPIPTVAPCPAFHPIGSASYNCCLCGVYVPASAPTEATP